MSTIRDASVTQVDRVVLGDGKVAYVLELDCPYLALIHFTSALGLNQVKRRKRSKRGLPDSKRRLQTSLITDGERTRVNVEIGFVSPLDAPAVVSMPEVSGNAPHIGASWSSS